MSCIIDSFHRRIGVCTHFERREIGWKVEHLVPRLLELGVGAVRQEIDWRTVEPVRGQLALPAVARDWVDRVHDAGLGIILLLCYGNPVYEDDLDVDAYARYAAFMARELRGRRIIAYELWNEPTNFEILTRMRGDWSGHGAAPWLERYAALVSAAAAAIRAVDPDATIITNPGEPQAFHLMRRFPEALAGVDGISHHPYPVRLPPETLPLGGGEISAHDGVAVADDDHAFASLFRRTREHAQATLGRELAMYATEMGYSTASSHRKPGWGVGVSERTQACYNVRLLIQALSAGVRTPCIYDLMDDGLDRHDGESNFGLVRNEARGWRPKPSFAAVQRLIIALGPDARPAAVAPATLEVEMRPLSRTFAWMQEPSEPFIRITGPQIAWFTVDGGYVCFVWMAGRAGQERMPPYGRLIWEFARDRVEVTTMIDLVSGEPLPLVLEDPPSCGSYSMRAILSDIPVADSPVAIRWTVSGAPKT